MKTKSSVISIISQLPNQGVQSHRKDEEEAAKTDANRRTPPVRVWHLGVIIPAPRCCFTHHMHPSGEGIRVSSKPLTWDHMTICLPVSPKDPAQISACYITCNGIWGRADLVLHSNNQIHRWPPPLNLCCPALVKRNWNSLLKSLHSALCFWNLDFGWGGGAGIRMSILRKLGVFFFSFTVFLSFYFKIKWNENFN